MAGNLYRVSGNSGRATVCRSVAPNGKVAPCFTIFVIILEKLIKECRREYVDDAIRSIAATVRRDVACISLHVATYVIEGIRRIT